MYLNESERMDMTTKLGFLLVFTCLLFGTVTAQFKAQTDQRPSVSEGLIGQSAPSLLLGWFNPDRFSMNHSFSLSYLTTGSQGLSLGTYTNSMRYSFADNLVGRADVSMSYSPYNSFAQHGKDDLSSVYLSRAQLDYKPWENFQVQLQYRALPYGSYSQSPFYNPWYRENGF